MYISAKGAKPAPIQLDGGSELDLTRVPVSLAHW
jgi:hypothetical protein